MAENAMLCDKNKTAKSTQVQGKSAPKPKMGSQPTVRACPHLCNMVPTNVPEPGAAQAVIHPGKDVFVVKIAKVGPHGDRRCKMELELVTPKGPGKKPLCRIDTREAQCDPEPCCCCVRKKKGKK